jgi:hypothetical protein
MQTIILTITNNPINLTAIVTAVILTVSFFSVMMPVRK